jgi:hypothetical protein
MKSYPHVIPKVKYLQENKFFFVKKQCLTYGWE